jgi:hypothetical protein
MTATTTTAIPIAAYPSRGKPEDPVGKLTETGAAVVPLTVRVPEVFVRPGAEEE